MKALTSLAVFAFALAISPAALAQFPTPSKEHQVLNQESGEWDAEVTMFMGPEGPYNPPQKSKAKEINRMLGGFWLVCDFKGEFEGVPLVGHAQFGYDAKNKVYTGTWIDSFTPTPTKMVGTYDPKTKTMSYDTKGTEMDGSPSKGKNIVVYGKDKRVMTMYAAAPGTDDMIKVMEVVYTKAK